MLLYYALLLIQSLRCIYGVIGYGHNQTYKRGLVCIYAIYHKIQPINVVHTYKYKWYQDPFSGLWTLDQGNLQPVGVHHLVTYTEAVGQDGARTIHLKLNEPELKSMLNTSLSLNIDARNDPIHTISVIGGTRYSFIGIDEF